VSRARRSSVGRLRSALAARSNAPLIERSGFFDPSWYVRAYPDVRAARYGAARFGPARHYLRHGYREGRNPGPLFDARWYETHHLDAGHRGENPLVQFLRAGAAEGRVACSLTVPAAPGRENIVVHQPAELRPPGSVAVMVHAYYPDTFDEICATLRRALRFPFTLLVSTPTDEVRAAADASIQRHGLPASATVRVVPNRGRNFGPFVAAFATEIAAHDYVLHLHTKRSLFTGSDQAHWRDQLVSSLVGSPAVAGAALQLLAGEAGGPGRPPIGLVFPTTAATMPHWAHHWLSNAAAAPGLFARLGVGRFPTAGYFEYPVGGMFWARVDAIRPLLDAGLTFDDFPVESGQTDGTLAHVIERCFVPLVQSRGYDFVELDRETGACQLGWGTSNLDQYQALSADGLREAIDVADVVSFDVFDTVVTRRSIRPDSVIRLAGERLRRLRPEADDFFAVRKEAEDRARAGRQWAGDVSLPEIYDAFPGSAPWDGELQQRALAIETDDDLATSVVRSTVADAVRHAHSLGKRVIGISDTYFERPHVERLLAQAGVGDCFDELYLSSERRARKDRGDLWDVVLDQEGVAADRWLHVGDNERSDIQAAADRGIRTYHCMNPTTLLELRGFRCLTAADAEHWGTDLLLGPVTATLANDPFLAGAVFDPVVVAGADDLGYAAFGPVVMAFLVWMAQHPALADVDHLYFLAREGHLLRQLWERVRATGRPDLPASTYLLTSRRASMAAAQAVSFDADQILQGFGFDGTVREMLASRIGLVLPEGEELADLRLTLPDDDVAARKILNELEDVIVAHGAGELEHMVGYLRQVGLAGPSTAGPSAAGVVDIGYSATIQKHLQVLVGRGLTGFYMGTLSKANEVTATGGAAYGCFAEDVPKWTPTSPFHRYSILLEAFLTAPQGQVERAEIHGHDVVHHFRPEYRTAGELEVIECLHAGATRYCEDLLRSYGTAILDVPIDLAAVLDLVTMVATGAIRSPAATSALVVDDDFCGLPRRVIMANGSRLG
jgi:FMN phosphatase YigB (HAD superfamily)